MFANTRSIQQTAFRQWSSELDVIKTVKELEARYARYLQKKSETDLRELLHCTCVTTYTQHLREILWGLPMEGITMPPQQEQVRLVAWETLTSEQARRSILISEKISCREHKPTSRGPHTPYFGSMTQMRSRRATLQVVEISSIITSLKSLLELRGWVKGNETLEQFIDIISSEKTTLSVEDLEKYTRRVYSGSISHRLPCPALRRGGMANQNLNHSSFYTITSDTAVEFAKGGLNYIICFQSCFLYGLSVLSHRTDMLLPTPSKTGLLFSCSMCTWLIPAESFTLSVSTYKGIDLPQKIEELHHKDLYERYITPAPIDETRSYAVLMGRKFAAWIVNRRMVDRITSLDNRALEESVTLSFVNLAEFSRLAVGVFLSSFIFYCAVYDSSFLGR